MQAHRYHHIVLSVEQNITGTIPPLHPFVTESDDQNNFRSKERAPPCGYIAEGEWRYGDASPFCDAPAERDSSYCARHRALCQVAPETSEGKRVAAGQMRAADMEPPPPPELRLGAVAVPELAEVETEEVAACLDLPPSDDARENGVL